MRNVGFLIAGLVLLIVQANAFRLIDGISVPAASVVVALALLVDSWAALRRRASSRGLSSVRADATLPAIVLLGYAILSSLNHSPPGRPLPGLVLPLILFMGVHEYSLARGATISFVLGYATDVFGIAPVGLYTFTYVATFLLARAAGVRLAAQTMWMQALLVGAFTTLQSIMVLLLLSIFGRDPWVPKCLYPLVLPHALATAAVAPAVFRLAEAIHRSSGSSPGADLTGARR